MHVSEQKQEFEIAALTQKLSHLSLQVNPQEAEIAANAAVRYPLQLAREYHAIPPAIINNIFINWGVRPRGLCYQWADDLTVKLMTLHLKTMELHRGVARLGTPHEHSCVVLTAPGQVFANGVALDAWRHCGRLNWSPVTLDKFPWQEVNLKSEYREELRVQSEALEKSPPPLH